MADVEKARLAADLDGLTKDSLNTEITKVFLRNKHLSSTTLAPLILAYMSYSDAFKTNTLMGMYGVVLKVLYNKERGTQVLLPAEMGGSYELIKQLAIDFEKGDANTVQMCTTSMFGHIPN